jgi:hypothetical protein
LHSSIAAVLALVALAGQDFRGSFGDINNSVSHKRPTVVNADGYLSTIIEVLNFDLRAKWQ